MSRSEYYRARCKKCGMETWEIYVPSLELDETIEGIMKEYPPLCGGCRHEEEEK